MPIAGSQRNRNNRKANKTRKSAHKKKKHTHTLINTTTMDRERGREPVAELKIHDIYIFFFLYNHEPLKAEAGDK